MNLIVIIVPGCILLPFIVVFFILIKKYFKYSKYYKKLETKLSVDKCIDLSVYTLTKSSSGADSAYSAQVTMGPALILKTGSANSIQYEIDYIYVCQKR